MDTNTYREHYPRLYESLTSAEAKFPELLAKTYPRILQRVELLWDSKDAVSYLDSLFLGDSPDYSGRAGRQGFPLEVLKEIVLLKQSHVNPEKHDGHCCSEQWPVVLLVEDGCDDTPDHQELALREVDRLRGLVHDAETQPDQGIDRTGTDAGKDDLE